MKGTTRLYVFALALGIRVVAILWRGPANVEFGDARDYLATADQICRVHAYPDRGNLPFFRAPLLPSFIAATTLCRPQRVAVVKFALAVCDSATALFIGEIAWMLFASSGVATLAAGLAALDPFFVLAAAEVRTEPLFMLLLTAAIWLFLRWARAGPPLGLALAGAAFALAALARPAGLAALAFAVVSLVWGGGSKASRAAKMSLLAAGAALALAPWVARNALRYHELILVNDAAGYSFWRGSHPEMDRLSRITNPVEYSRAARAFESDLTPRVALAIETRSGSPRARSRAWFAAGLEQIGRDPGEAAAFAARRAGSYWRPWLNPQEHAIAAVFGSAAFNVGVFAFAAIGLSHFRKKDPFVVGWVVAFFVAMWLAHVPHQVVIRFRIPFTDPLLLVFAAGGAAALRAKSGLFSNPSSSGPPPPEPSS